MCVQNSASDRPVRSYSQQTVWNVLETSQALGSTGKCGKKREMRKASAATRGEGKVDEPWVVLRKSRPPRRVPDPMQAGLGSLSGDTRINYLKTNGWKLPEVNPLAIGLILHRGSIQRESSFNSSMTRALVSEQSDSSIDSG